MIDFGNYVSPELTGTIADNPTLWNAIQGGVPISDLYNAGSFSLGSLFNGGLGGSSNPLGSLSSLFGGGETGGETGGLTGGGVDWLPALIGAIIGGTQGDAADLETTQTPWNVDYLNQGQDAALNLMNNNPLNLPDIPNLPTMDDQFIHTAINAATAPMYYDFATKVMPAIRSDFGDAYGSTRQDIAYGLGMDALARNASNVSGQISSALYPQKFKSEVDSILFPYEQATGQAIQKWQAPWTNVTNAANVFTGAAGKGSTTTTPMPDTPWWQTAMGGAITANQLWSDLFGGNNG